MDSRTGLMRGLGLVALGVLAGCAQRTVTLVPGNPLDIPESAVVRNPDDNNYILTRMEFARLAMMLGAYDRAAVRLREAVDQLEVQRANTAAALGSEAHKYYKGESYERAMLYFYLGYAAYYRGEYNDARICLERALSADREAVVKPTTPTTYGEDFGLAYYWLAKTYLRLGQRDSARIAFQKAAQEPERRAKVTELKKDLGTARRMAARRLDGERWALRTFHDPSKPALYVGEMADLTAAPTDSEVFQHAGDDPGGSSGAARCAASRTELFDDGFQEQVNTTLTIELGRGPFKYLTGLHGSRTEITRAFVLPHTVQVYIDDRHAGTAIPLLDMWDQAATQDRIVEKDLAQATKAVLKEVLSHAPYAGFIAGYWDVSGDARCWASLPGRVHVFAARLAPGTHTVRLEMADAAGNPLPRWTATYHGIHVPPAGETCVLLNPVYDADNVLPGAQRKAAFAAGARPVSEDVLVSMPRRAY